MTENEFLDFIDCNFPYNDIEKGIQLINDGLNISDLCIYGIIYELVRFPKKIKKENIKYYLNYINDKFNDKLKDDIIGISFKLVDNEIIDESVVLSLMEKVKKYSSNSIVLNILYFAIDDINGEIEKKYDEVIYYWKNMK